MDAVACGSLFIMLGNTQMSILDCNVTEAPNEHGILLACAETKAELKDYLLYEEDENVGLFAVSDGSCWPLFYGMVVRMEASIQGKRCVLYLEAVTYSYQMDLVTRNRSFQDTAMTSHQLIGRIMEPYINSQVLFSIEDKKIGQVVVQYQETDWDFLKRVLSMFGIGAYIAGNEPGVFLRVGLMDMVEDANWDSLPYVIQRDVSPKGEGQGIERQICYQVESYDILPIGEKVTYQGKELYVGKIERLLRRGLLVNRYNLYFAAGLRVPRYYNSALGGVSITGEVTGVRRNRVQVCLETDMACKCGQRHFFPFSTIAASPDGSGWYCMPQKGDRVRIFFPTADESEGYAIANILGESRPIDGSSMSNPDMKDITTPDGKAVKFVQGGIQLTVGDEKGTVTLTNDGNAKIETNEDIEIGAAEAVCFSTDHEMNIMADGQIRFINDTGGNITVSYDTIEFNAKRIFNN